MRTASEILFERFCAAADLHLEQIEPEIIPTPDYRLVVGGTAIIVEVKQLDPNETDKEIARQIIEKGRAWVCFVPGTRVRQEISDSRRQIRRAKGELPAMVVLYDNTGGGSGQVKPHDVLTAMYGEDVVVVHKAGDPFRVPDSIENRFGGMRGVTPAHNTTLSAVAVLSHDDSASCDLKVYHNRHAALPISIPAMRHSLISHFILPSGADGTYRDWQPA